MLYDRSSEFGCASCNCGVRASAHMGVFMKRAGSALLAFLMLAGAAPAQDDLSSAEKDFKEALRLQAPKPLEDALKKIVSINTAAAARVVLGGIKGSNETHLYWMLVNASASFSSREALAEVTKSILANKQSPVSRDMTSALGGNNTSGCESALVAILRDGTTDLQVLVVEHMMDVGQKETVEAVIETLRKG